MRIPVDDVECGDEVQHHCSKCNQTKIGPKVDIEVSTTLSSDQVGKQIHQNKIKQDWTNREDNLLEQLTDYLGFS